MIKKTKLSENIKTAEQDLVESELNYIVEEAKMRNVNTERISNKIKSLYRSDTGDELGIVRNTYYPVQNSVQFAYFDTMCQKENMSYTETLSVNNGEKVILKAELPDIVTIGNNDLLKRQFCLINGFDGITCLSANTIFERINSKCILRGNIPNTINSWKFRHTKNIEIRMEEVMKVLSEGTLWFDKFLEIANELNSKIVDDHMVKHFMNSVFGTSESPQIEHKKTIVQNCFEKGIGNNGSTAWDLYNAVTEYVSLHHGKDEKRGEWANFGRGIELTEKAFNIAVIL